MHDPIPAASTRHNLPPLTRTRWGVYFWAATLTAPAPIALLTAYLIWELA